MGKAATVTLSVPRPLQASAGAASAAVDTSRSPSPQLGGLSEEFSRSYNLRAFAEKARQRPSEGGLSYANAAVGYCWKVRTLLADLGIKNGQRGLMGEQDSVVYGRRQKAVEELHRKCAEFTEQELFGSAAMVSVGELLAKRDSVFIAVKSVLDAKRGSDAAAFADALRLALISKDPLVLEGIFPQVLFNRNKTVDGVSLIFDGQPIPAEEVQPALQASMLVRCLYGSWCGSGNFDVASNCATTVDCHANVLKMEAMGLRMFALERIPVVEKYLNRFKDSLDRVDTARYSN